MLLFTDKIKYILSIVLLQKERRFLLQAYHNKFNIPFESETQNHKFEANIVRSIMEPINTVRTSCDPKTITFVSNSTVTSQSPTQQAPSTVSTQPANTFYRRPLPTDKCTALSSPNGRLLFSSAMQGGGLNAFFPLMENHLTQSEPAYCGISTLVLSLNALAVDPRRTWKGPWRWYEESMLNCCIDLEEVKTTGITLPKFKCLAVCQGLMAEVTYADEDENSFEEKFREAVIEACVEKKTTIVSVRDNNLRGEINDDDNDHQHQVLKRVLIVSYNRRVLGQSGTGHFSPIGAYDPVSDSVLIMDTARFKYGTHWVKLSLLAEAMKPADPDTGRSRGFVNLINPPATLDEKGTDIMDGSLPVSILLRSSLKQKAARKEFKAYLDEKKTLSEGGTDLTYFDVASFWTRNGTDPVHILETIQPLSNPFESDGELVRAVQEVRVLINELMEQTDGVAAFRDFCPEVVSGYMDCRTNHCRTLKIRPEEAIFITYLASLDEKRQKEIIFHSQTKDTIPVKSDQSRHQLLAEAQLVKLAIGVSDQV